MLVAISSIMEEEGEEGEGPTTDKEEGTIKVDTSTEEAGEHSQAGHRRSRSPALLAKPLAALLPTLPPRLLGHSWAV